MTNLRRFEIPLVLWGFALNLVWEFAQSPLYADHVEGWRYLVWTRFHCTLGDVLILLGAFWATAAAYRSWSWPVTRGNAATVMFLVAGLLYTSWSEWFNTSVRGAWSYAPAMPTVLGVGLAPLLQWLVLPPLLILILRASAKRAVSTGGIE